MYVSLFRDMQILKDLTGVLMMRVYALYDCQVWVAVLFIVIFIADLAIAVVCTPIHLYQLTLNDVCSGRS